MLVKYAQLHIEDGSMLRKLFVTTLLITSTSVFAKGDIILSDGTIVKKEPWMAKVESHVRNFLSYKSRTGERATCDFEIITDAKGKVLEVNEIVCFPLVTKAFGKEVAKDIYAASPVPVSKENAGKSIYITVKPY